MPIIMIYGVPSFSNTEPLKRLTGDLQKVASDIEELHLTPDQVSVFFPSDRLYYIRDRPELIVFINGLFPRSERTLEVRQRLAEAIHELVKAFAREYFPNCKLVEVFVRPFDPSDAFAGGPIERNEE